VRDTLEAFAGDVADEQAQRQKKRKRGEEKTEVLKVRRVHVEGFETEQVWQQAKRVIEGVLRHADTVLDELQDEGLVTVDGEDEDEEPQIEELESEGVEDEESGDFDEEDDEDEVGMDEEDMLDL
jgi:U3 small nucleolar RNA-associated protein MPP10